MSNLQFIEWLNDNIEFCEPRAKAENGTSSNYWTGQINLLRQIREKFALESPSPIEREENRPRWVKPETNPDKPGRYYAKYIGGYSDEVKTDMFYWNGINWLTGPSKIVCWLSESPSPALPKEEETGEFEEAVSSYVDQMTRGSRPLTDLEQGVLQKTVDRTIKRESCREAFIPEGEVRYYHDAHCSANPFEPMGNEGCSCRIVIRARIAEKELLATEERVSELEKENADLRVEVDNQKAQWFQASLGVTEQSAEIATLRAAIQEKDDWINSHR